LNKRNLVKKIFKIPTKTLTLALRDNATGWEGLKQGVCVDVVGEVRTQTLHFGITGLGVRGFG
jgi:hypothetical protein